MADTDLDRIHERLRSIESNLKRALQQLNLEWVEPTEVQGVPDEVVQLAKAGDFLSAIKRYRELTGVGLGEAKAIVEKITP